MKRNVVLALLVVLAMAIWRIHVHHTQLAVPATKSREALPIVVAHPSHIAPHGGSIAGTVRDDAGAAIAGARVCASGSSSALPGDLTRDPRCARTGANGAYAIQNLYAADYTVSAMAKQFTLETYAPKGQDQPPNFPLASNEERRGVDLVLHHGGFELSGTVSDASGGEIARAQVRVYSSWQRNGYGSVAVETDEHGHYEAWARAGSVTLAAVADGYAPVMRSATAPSEVNLVLVPESILAGTVVDVTTGEPVADVNVNASSADTWYYAEGTLTDEHGRFTLDRLRPGRYIATARTSHGTGTSDGSTLLGLGQRVDGVVVQLHPAHQVVGRVVADGKPCANPTLSLVDERQNLQPEVVRDDDGTLHADGVLPGVYIPSPACDDHVRRDRYDPIVVTDHDVTATWAVDPGASITGHVRTASGAPLANAEVLTWGAATGQRVPTTNDNEHTTLDGEYTLRGLRAGHYQLFVNRAEGMAMMGGSNAAKIEVDVAAAETVHRDLVVPDGAGSIVGRVTAAHGAAGRVSVQARSATGDTVQVASDDAGRFEIPTLDPGTYELVVLGATDHGLSDNLTPQPVKVDVRAGTPTTANLVIETPTGVIRGRVVDDHGAPITDAFVGLAFEHDEAPAIQNARSDGDEILVGSDGRFVAEHLTKGPYTLSAHRKGGGEAVVAHVALGSDITLTIQPTGEISGVAHRAGGPIDDLHVTIFDRDTLECLRDETFFRTDGKFAVHDLPAGHYRLVVATGGSERLSYLHLVEGQHATVDVELDSNVTLVGRIVDARSHTPVAGVEVYASLTDINMSFLIPSDMRDTSDADGRFEVPNVPRGELDISGHSFDDGKHSFDPVTLRRVVTESDPDVLDLGDVLVVSSSSSAALRGDAGLSIYVGEDPRAAKVFSVDPDSVAAQAGIVAGDVITAVDGIDVTGDAADEARLLVTGDAGTELSVTLERGETVTLVLAGTSH